jgi:TetR/AcrR family transcriptional regulator, transcriptional repressor for nem operon
MARPREYDEAALLAHAMEAFWSRGYRGTSIEDLVVETGVSRASLYSAYPDKHALFLESVRRYLDGVVNENVRRLMSAEPAGEAIRQFFLQLVDAPRARLRRGCLLTNCAVELGAEDKDASALVRQAFTRVENALHDRLVEARKAGALAAHIEPRSYARQLITLLQGVRVMARAGVDREMLKDAMHAALSGITVSPEKEATPGAPRIARQHKNRRGRGG